VPSDEEDAIVPGGFTEELPMPARLAQQEDENAGAGPHACPSVAAKLERTRGSAPTIDH
jgi:hypothetical protein